MPRILITGGRDFNDRVRLWALLDILHKRDPITAIIHGAARGADRLGQQWALSRGIQQEEFPAQWDLHGIAAGVIRNTQMLNEGKPDYIVACPGGKGTADMVRKARNANIPIIFLDEVS